MTEIEELKGQIKVLEKKLALLEEIEEYKSPVEKAYRDAYGSYPITDDMSGSDIDYVSWDAFQKGYNAAYEEKITKEPEENEWKLVALKLGEKLSDIGPCGYYDFTPGEWLEWALNEFERGMIKRNLKTSLQEREKLQEKDWNAVRESMKWCEENPGKDPLDWVKPQTPEQVADGLKEAFREAVNQGVVSSVDKPKKNRDAFDDMMDEMVAKFKGQTLTDLIYDWWEDIFTVQSNDDMETSISDLVERIKHWLPKEQSAAGSQNAYVESAVEGFNDAINKIRRKLR